MYVEKVLNNRKIILVIIDVIKLCGRLGLTLRGHRDASKYHPEIGHAPTSAGVGNFLDIINCPIRNGDQEPAVNVKHVSQQLLKMIY